MKTYIVTATVADEICIADRHGAANEYLSLDYIPGTAWWGALAGCTGIRPGQEPAEKFRCVFYSNEVCFTNLYPLEAATRAHPIPLSARTPKSAPGFEHDADILFRDESDNLYPAGVKDLLLSGLPRYEPDWEPISGWYAGDPPRCRPVSVPMVLRGHSERSGRSGTTRQGRLFIRQNIRRNQRFEGALCALTPAGETALAELLRNYLGSEAFEVPVGRQPGHLRIELNDGGDEPPYWRRHDLQVGGEDDSILTVTLLSDAVLVDRWLRPWSFLPPAMVAAALDLPADAIELVHHFSAVREAFGWNSAYSRPRETERVAVAGSAFCYQVVWPAEILPEERRRRLNAWQQRGVGLRSGEGFGEIRLNDPFHRAFGGGGSDAGQ